MAVIRLHNMTFYGYHGASHAERETGRRYEVDCELHVDAGSAARSDRLEDTLNYTTVYALVEQIINRNRFHLLETVAARICAKLAALNRVERTVVRVRKRIPPIPGHIDYIEVEWDSDQDAAGKMRKPKPRVAKP